jgi:FAD/FMN-containing dehydrogenase
VAHRKSPARIAQLHHVARLRELGTNVAAAASGGPGWNGAADLQARIVGTVVLPSDPAYDLDRQESNPAFQAFPQVIVYCAVESDVVACLEVARSSGLWVAVRSGGHSTAGYSVNSGMVIDVSRLSYTVLDESTAIVHVGAGTDFDHFNGGLEGTGWHVPSGACGNVCVGGFVQGGGYGYTSRAFGIQSDSVVSFRVALADGRIVRASAMENADLYWALKGGGGGSFGVLLQVTYRMVPLASVWAWAISWDEAHAAEVLDLMQESFTRGAPDSIGYMMNLGYYKGQAVFMVQGMYCGSSESGKAALEPLLSIPSANLLVHRTGTYPAMNRYLDIEPYSLPDNMPDTPRETKASCYIARPLGRAGWQRVVDYFLTAPNLWAMVYTEPYGGAINRVPPLETAFIHRDVDMNVVIDTVWTTEAERVQCVSWLEGFMQLLAPFSNGHVYQNYVDPSLKDYRTAYWGEAFDRLLAVKQKYDPDNFFHFQQSISPRVI